jgi:hypothetical protein
VDQGGSKDFSRLNYEEFRRLAADPSLSPYERIGFPDSYRKGYEEAIFRDICAKLPALDGPACSVLDVGPGVSELPRLLIGLCARQGHTLALVDSQEMLSQLPDSPSIEKTVALFPHCPALLEAKRGKIDVLLSYSVLHYVFVDTPLFGFLDSCLGLLAPGGHCLLGDVPNVSMRKRFFASEAGIRFHQQHMKTQDKPEVLFNRLEEEKIDDAVVAALMARARAAGFHAYVLPQAPTLPMANRREDLLFVRP